jgi:flagellar biosynthesis protein FlhG
MNNNTIIIPIASGKGGVGKSIITANLAISLANLGHSVVAVGLDLGGSNLYSYLGLENKYHGIGDYLNTKQGKLTDYLVQTDFANLRFLAGERRITFMANLPHAQKLKLISEIKNIQSDYILLDLGAGTTFNTLDYFDFSRNGIVISTFEKPSILNTLSFIKNFIYRVIIKETRQNHKVSSDINKAYKNAVGDELLLISEIIDIINKTDQALALKVKDTCNSYHPRIIFNKGEHPDNLEIISQLQNVVKKILSIDLCFFGFIFEDVNVKLSTNKSEVLLNQYPDCIASRGIKDIAKRIIKFNSKDIPNSNELLRKDTLAKFELWNPDLKQ